MSNSVTFSEIGSLINALKNGNIERAKKRCEAAKKEYDAVSERINVTDKKKVKCLIEFIDDVGNGRQQVVTERENIAWKIILDYYVEEHRKTGSTQNKAGTSGTVPETPYSDQRQDEDHETNVREPHSNASGFRQDIAGTTLVDEYAIPEPITKRGVLAIATEFHDLYEDEWLHAYEYLDDKIEEKEKVQVLLEIVQKAYQFNVKEAKRQCQEAEKAAKSIVAGPRTESSPVEFKKKKLAKLFADKGMDPPKEGKSVDLYTRKAVELTWWMCVQDPPIHMCLSSERPSDSECPGLYRAFTRFGKIPDYFVWPALKLHKNGGVLMKGVMQFK